MEDLQIKPRVNKYAVPNEDQTTLANSNFVKSNSGPFKQSDQSNNLVETLPSGRHEPDEVLLRAPSRPKQGHTPPRDSLVGKSLKSIGNIIKKAKEADFTSIVGRPSVTAS